MSRGECQRVKGMKVSNPRPLDTLASVFQSGRGEALLRPPFCSLNMHALGDDERGCLTANWVLRAMARAKQSLAPTGEWGR